MINQKYVNISELEITEFEGYLKIRKGLSDSTVKLYLRLFRQFVKNVRKESVTSRDIEDYLSKSRSKRNDLAMLKALFRDFIGIDIVGQFKIPKNNIKPKILPDIDKIKVFFDALPRERDKTIFLFLASSGLRLGELLGLKNSDIDFGKRMIIPDVHNGQTKHSWITFYNKETEQFLKQHRNKDGLNNKLFNISRNHVERIFQETSEKTGIKITPQTLRSIFTREMTFKQVSDRYIDAFCGRAPNSNDQTNNHCLKDLRDDADMSNYPYPDGRRKLIRFTREITCNGEIQNEVIKADLIEKINREDEMYQAIHRIRPLGSPKKIYVFGIVPEKVKEELTYQEIPDINHLIEDLEKHVRNKERKEFDIETLFEDGKLYPEIVKEVMKLGYSSSGADKKIKKLIDNSSEWERVQTQVEGIDKPVYILKRINPSN